MLSLRPSGPGSPLIVGHRGASGCAPENTMPAFRLAVEQGADLVELDVHLSADGVPVVIHDPTVDRTTDGHGLVVEKSVSQLKALDAGLRFGPTYAGGRIPTLEEVLAWAAGRIPLAIEIKSGPVRYPGIESLVLEALRVHGMTARCMVISFDHSAVLRARQLCPDVATGVLFAGAPIRPSSLAAHAGAQALLPHWSDLTREMVEDAHANGLAVSTWVVDGESEMRWVLALGVDAVATNYPGRLAALLRGPRSE